MIRIYGWNQGVFTYYFWRLSCTCWLGEPEFLTIQQVRAERVVLVSRSGEPQISTNCFYFYSRGFSGSFSCSSFYSCFSTPHPTLPMFPPSSLHPYGSERERERELTRAQAQRKINVKAKRWIFLLGSPGCKNGFWVQLGLCFCCGTVTREFSLHPINEFAPGDDVHSGIIAKVRFAIRRSNRENHGVKQQREEFIFRISFSFFLAFISVSAFCVRAFFWLRFENLRLIFNVSRVFRLSLESTGLLIIQILWLAPGFVVRRATVREFP